MGFYIDFDYSKGKWFSYPPQPELQLKIRYLAPAAIMAMRSQFVNGEEGVDAEKLAKAMREYIIIDWKGFYTGEGKNAKPAPFTRENLDKVHKIDLNIFRWAADIASDRSNFDPENNEEKLEKN